MGYVWCDGYVWDMCCVRYANNLLKNPATKRLSGKRCAFQIMKHFDFPVRLMTFMLMTSSTVINMYDLYFYSL